MAQKNITISETVRINSLAIERQRQGMPVFNLGAGEPVLNTPKIIKQAAQKALNENKTLYPPVQGILQLRQLATVWMNKKFKTSYYPQNVLVTNGGKLGIYLILQSLLKLGDEVVFSSPYWVSYPGIVKLFGGTAKIIKTSAVSGWKISANDLKRACGKKTKILILNNANNPTGALYSKSELADILNVAAKKNLTTISDEVYSGLVYDKNKFTSCASFAKHRNRVIVIQSCSKNFAMTGWRVGFVFADEAMIKELTILLSQSTSGVTTISQWAAIAALKNPEKFTKPLRLELQKRRDVLVNSINKHFNLNLASPASSLYLFVSLKDLGVANKSSAHFCMSLLKKTGVALIPGSACGQEGYVRLTFGAKPQTIKSGIKLLADYCQKIR